MGVSSGRGSTNTSSVSICAAIQKCNYLGVGNPRTLQVEQTWRRKSNHPEYVFLVLFPSQLSGNIWTIRGRPDLVSMILQPSVEQSMLGVIYQDSNNNIHVNIKQCPRNELVEHDG